MATKTRHATSKGTTMKATTNTDGLKAFAEWLAAKEEGSRKDYEGISKFRFDKEVKSHYKGLAEAYEEVRKEFDKRFKV